MDLGDLDFSDLKNVENEMSEMEGRLKTLGLKHQELCKLKAQDVAKELFREVDIFIKLFTTGLAARSFNKIIAHIETLSQFDKNYQQRLAGDAYDVGLSGPKAGYLAELFGGKWRPDSDLWTVLGQISDTINASGNPFASDKKE